MSNIGSMDTEALVRANRIYWKSLLALFCTAFAIIAFILVYLLTDWLLSKCEPISWLQRLLGREKECDRSPSIFLITVAAGALGAIFSNITRLHQAGEISALFAERIIAAKFRNMTLYATVTAVIGAVAAAVIYLIFAGKFIQGTPFPAFECVVGQTCNGIDALINLWGPKEAADYAKMIFWGFVGGFSERLIPDMLGQYSKLIEQRAAEAGKQTPPPNVDALLKAKATADADKAAADKARSKATELRAKVDETTASPEEKAAAARAETEAAALEQKARTSSDAYRKLGGV